jgi:hypothetical protein
VVVAPVAQFLAGGGSRARNPRPALSAGDIEVKQDPTSAENCPYNSEGGEAKPFPTPINVKVSNREPVIIDRKGTVVPP